MLDLRDVHTYYGNIRALRGISLTVQAREVVTLIGSNGAGKSTTLKTIIGTLKPQRGEIQFEGHRIDGVSSDRVVRLGIAQAPEGRRIFPRMTVLENLELGAYTRRDRGAVADALARTWEVFPILGERRSQRAGTLSGGQQQMLAIARATMSSPRLLLVDEASLGLSPVMAQTAYDLLRRANETTGTALLVVDQNVLALDLARRVYVLEKGQVVDVAEGAAVPRMQRRLQEAYLGRADQ